MPPFNNKSTSNSFSSSSIFISFSAAKEGYWTQPKQLRLGETGNLNFVAFLSFSLCGKLLGHFHLGSNHRNYREDLSLLSSSGVGAKTLFTPIFRFYQPAVNRFWSRFVKDASGGYLDSVFIACSLLNSKAMSIAS